LELAPVLRCPQELALLPVERAVAPRTGLMPGMKHKANEKVVT